MESIPDKGYCPQSSDRALASPWDRYLVLRARQHRGTTAPRLTCDLTAVSRRTSGKTVYSRHAEISVPLNAFGKKTRYCGAEYISQGLQKWGLVLFSDESKYARQTDFL
ncbi:hypothetical protein TNCV_2727421 [Trichonephila clavipes]|nr:hypothetical protein TNCV_2727421 [Trichonephila clavipes]